MRARLNSSTRTYGPTREREGAFMGVQRGNAVASYATRQRPRVAIIGSGFAGRRAHDVLRRNGVEVHILDERGMMEFSPGVLRAMVEPEHTKRVLLRHPQQVEGKRAHSPRDGAVEVEGEGEREVDCTIVATGKPYARPIRPAREAGTHAVKERAGEIESEAEAIAGSGTIAVIGGGTVGVELAAEIAGKFRGTKGVYLVSSRPQILPRAPARAAEFAAQWLTKRNVTIVPNARALETEDGRLLVNGRDMTCDRTYWCTGSGESGTWRCDIFLCAQGRNQTFVAGDCGSWEGEKNALNGHLTGQLAAKNCLRLLRGQSLGKWPEGEVGAERPPEVACISLYKWSGCMFVGRLCICGKIAALAKWAVEALQTSSLPFVGAVWLILERMTVFFAKAFPMSPEGEGGGGALAPTSTAKPAN